MPRKTKGISACICLLEDEITQTSTVKNFLLALETLKAKNNLNLLLVSLWSSQMANGNDVVNIIRFKIPDEQGDAIKALKNFIIKATNKNVPNEDIEETDATGEETLFITSCNGGTQSCKKGRYPSNNDSCLGESLHTNHPMGFQLNDFSTAENQNVFDELDEDCFCPDDPRYCKALNQVCLPPLSQTRAFRSDNHTGCLSMNGPGYCQRINGTRSVPGFSMKSWNNNTTPNGNGTNSNSFHCVGNSKFEKESCDFSFIAPTPSMLSVCETQDDSSIRNVNQVTVDDDKNIGDIMDELAKVNQRSNSLQPGEVCSVYEAKV